MKMTKRQAQTLALQILYFYKTQPYCRRKKKFLPDDLKKKVEPLKNLCPLCDLFSYDPREGRSCRYGNRGACPLVCPTCGDFRNISLNANIDAIKEWRVT